MLGDRRPGDPLLPADLQDAVREWTAYAATVALGGRADERLLLRRRGRQLASRVADVLGRPVEFTDPVTGAVESVPSGAAIRLPASGPPGPTPWSTGLAVSAFVAVLVTVGDVALSRAFAGAFGLLWLPANLLVGLGLSPSLWLARRTPLWRWPALGAIVGLGAAWVVLILGLLG